MISILKDIGRTRATENEGRYVFEHSPVGSSASNGMVEGYIQSVGGQMRSMKSALGSRRGAIIDPKHPIITWVVEYAAYFLHRCEVSRDGETAYERCKGKLAKVYSIEFGEAVWWKRKREGGA